MRSINKTVEILTFEIKDNDSFPYEVIVACELVRKGLSEIGELECKAMRWGGRVRVVGGRSGSHWMEKKMTLVTYNSDTM